MSKKTAISNVSRAIQKTMACYKRNTSLIENKAKQDFSIKIANTLEEREAVFRLAYQVYLEKGYVSENPNQWLIQPYDTNQETTILIVQDKNKNIAGTLTLVFSESCTLPAETLYHLELNELKNREEKIAEISRLVIHPAYRNSKEVLLLLFNYLAIYTTYVKKYHHVAIQVNPRHCEYYKTILCFEKIGNEKPCPQVGNAPAILLNLPVKKYQSEISRCQSKLNCEKKERSLFQYFLKREQEGLVANYLSKQTKPLTADEKIYFGLSESGICNSVCV